MEFDFSGYATKNGLKCTDGRTILKDAFAHQNGHKVPLVWQHLKKEPSNVLGHAILENREDGVYAYCKLNETKAAQDAKLLLKHGDIDSMSIWANHLKQNGDDVLHGNILEVSLVMAGANPGAKIDNLYLEHSDGTRAELDDEAIIYCGEKFTMGGDISHADDDGKTVQEVWDSLTEEQQNVVKAMMVQLVEDGAGAEGEEPPIQHSNEGGNIVKINPFAADGGGDPKATLTHDQFSVILQDAQKNGSFKAAFLAHAQSYGIENIDILFPDAKMVTNPPDWIKRDTAWVSGVINGAKHTPFSRIKSAAADITDDAARAKGYVKGNLKKEEVFKLLKRVTGPTTIYKKQKLDRDDIIDITDLDVVAWMKAEMRVMLDEEIARAVLIGDGREADDDDKINEECIRPIWKDADMYAHHVDLENDATVEEKMEAILRAMEVYEGSGSPTLYIAPGLLTDMLLLKDKINRRYYNTVSDVAAALGVSNIVTVPVMKDQKDDDGNTLFGIIVNIRDYTIGADRGGQISMFDDFDIDYNQYKYLLETRISGCLTHPKSALVIQTKKATTPVTPPTGGQG